MIMFRLDCRVKPVIPCQFGLTRQSGGVTIGEQ
jgi:hypothetical protein